MDDTQLAPIPTLDLELRRGVIVLAVLSQLHAPRYGYALKKALAEGGLDVDEGTLYPLLRRLEAQRLLSSEWRVEEGRPRRYYVLSPDGARAEAALVASWNAMIGVMNKLLGVGAPER